MPGIFMVFWKPGKHYRQQEQKRDDKVLDSCAFWDYWLEGDGRNNAGMIEKEKSDLGQQC